VRERGRERERKGEREKKIREKKKKKERGIYSAIISATGDFRDSKVMRVALNP